MDGIDIDEFYQVIPEPFRRGCQDRGAGADGTGEAARPRDDWRAIESWGRDGWDLGSWPSEVIYHRDRLNSFDLAIYIDGAVDAYRFPTRALRDNATDRLAFFYWQRDGREWVEGFASAGEMPGRLRDPYSPVRLNGIETGIPFPQVEAGVE